MNSVEIANALINRAKNLQEFEVRRILEKTLSFNGTIPFDMSIKDDCGWFKVFAESQKEAEEIVDQWLIDHYDY
jgi:MinD superfamily P-loop ATPase